MARRRALALAPIPIALAGLLLASCGGDDGRASTILIDGSSTVAPLSSAMAEAYAATSPDVGITVATSGTGGGFARFCAGETDISDASREIEGDEAATCASNGIEYTEVRVASDGITLVTSTSAVPRIGGRLDLSLEQLAAIWGPDSRIDDWDQIPGGGYRSAPLTLAGPGSQSGTYDFFNEKVLGTGPDGEPIESRQDYQASEDDNVIVRAVEGAEAGLGYFGFTYYEENAGALAPFAVNGVTPSVETITSGRYPLSRPLFLYVRKDALTRPEVVGFVGFYLDNAVRVARENGFVPAPEGALKRSRAVIRAAEAGEPTTTEG